MRYLLNTYVQADPAEELGELGEMSLTELIVATGIHDAIARQLNKRGKLSKNAIAEGIINNVRKTIVREQLTDPKFYAEMSKLLGDLINLSRADATTYEAFLKKAEELARQIVKKTGGDYPSVLHGKPEAIVLFRNLAGLPVTTFQCPEEDEGKAQLALAIDQSMRDKAQAGWKGDEAKERLVQNFLHKEHMQRDGTAMMAIFNIIKNQPGY
jgi:type I restriction enzyme R subunit